MSEEEREAVKREFRERFAPGARAMPNTVSGLAALANERIEDAIARGQFKNIPRGKGVERDTRADNPFIDTVSGLCISGVVSYSDVYIDRVHHEQDDQAARDCPTVDRKTAGTRQSRRDLPRALAQ